METERDKVIGRIAAAIQSYEETTGRWPQVLHMPPVMLYRLRRITGMLAPASPEEDDIERPEFMGCEIETDKSLPADMIVADDSLRRGVGISYDESEGLWRVSVIKADGSPVGKPYVANTIEQARRAASDTRLRLGKDYSPYKE